MTAVSKTMSALDLRAQGQGGFARLFARLKILVLMFGEGFAESRQLAREARAQYPFFAEW